MLSICTLLRTKIIIDFISKKKLSYLPPLFKSSRSVVRNYYVIIICEISLTFSSVETNQKKKPTFAQDIIVNVQRSSNKSKRHVSQVFFVLFAGSFMHASIVTLHEHNYYCYITEARNISRWFYIGVLFLIFFFLFSMDRYLNFENKTQKFYKRFSVLQSSTFKYWNVRKIQ